MFSERSNSVALLINVEGVVVVLVIFVVVLSLSSIVSGGKQENPTMVASVLGQIRTGTGATNGEVRKELYPCSETYRGAHPFSEVEIVNVAKFLASKGDRVVGYMDIHAYSQLWMFPWGYTKIPAKDNEELVN